MPGVVKMYPKTNRWGYSEEEMSFEESDIRTRKGREKLVSDDQLRNWEDGFLMGFHAEEEEILDL